MFRHFQNMALFAILVKNGSFTRTAEELNMTKSRVSQKINALEEQLGLRLLNRTTRKVSLTDAGERYLPYCQEMIDTAQRAEGLVQRLREIPAGKLRVIAPPGFMHSILPVVHNDFLKKYPQVELELTTADSFFGSVNDIFDIAFRIGKPSDDLFIGRFLGNFNRFIVGSPEYVSKYPIARPSELLNCDLITHKAWKSITLQKSTARYELAMNMRHTCDNLTYILHQSLQGAGLAILPEYIVAPYLKSGQLNVVLPDWTVQQIELWMIYPSSKNNTLALRNYIDLTVNSDIIKSLAAHRLSE
ncbi:LysR family transcriptional regulator [Enterobacter sp. R1(2018)]|nr:LysR family transcriptional regulator [Enterobacter sp. R1(2018)]